jgi:hypothetical protein
VQFGLFKTIQYGRMVSFFSQKYIMVSIFAFAFVYLEQQTYMEKTQYIQNLNILKWGIVIIFILALGMGFGFLPMKYLSIHNEVFSMLESFTDNNFQKGIVDPAITQAALEIQDSLENYDLNWLFIKNITGYGNLLTLLVIGGGFLVQRVFFRQFPIRKIFENLFPETVIKFWDQMVETLGLINQESNDNNKTDFE